MRIQTKKEPFYVNVSRLVPHALLKPTPDQLAVYADLVLAAPHPAFGPWTQDYLAKANDLKRQMQVYCASLTAKALDSTKSLPANPLRNAAEKTGNAMVAPGKRSPN